MRYLEFIGSEEEYSDEIIYKGKPTVELIEELSLEESKRKYITCWVTTANSMGSKGWRLEATTPIGKLANHETTQASHIRTLYVFSKES